MINIAPATKQLTITWSLMDSNLEFSHKSQTVTVSRSTHFSEDGHFTPDGEVLARLEGLLKARFDFELSPTRRQKKRALGGRPESIQKIKDVRESSLRYSL